MILQGFVGSNPARAGDSEHDALLCATFCFGLFINPPISLTLSRRLFLRNAAAVAVGFSGLHSVASFARSGLEHGRMVTARYGRLVTDPLGLLDLPLGFSYRIISTAGDRMEDGFILPGRPDGMAAFAGTRGETILVRNHEIGMTADADQGPFGPNNVLLSRIDKRRIYDVGTGDGPALGGTTTLVYDTEKQERLSQHLSLAGSLINCAGGPTPWNTWITCEETTNVRAGNRWKHDHGYNFEVPVGTTAFVSETVPLKDMGRFRHEAVAVHPETGIVYETEDMGTGLVYRFIPNVPGELHKGGRLQALSIVGKPSFVTLNHDEQTVVEGERLKVTWIDLDGVDSMEYDLKERGFAAGAAQFSRGEGMWFGNGSIYFACTDGGSIRKGQIWKYDPSPYEGTSREEEDSGILELFIEPNDSNLVKNCDNITMAPWGDLIVCEDSGVDQNLIGVTPSGEIYKLAHNAKGDSEFAGAVFSPDGSTLFVNIQIHGTTIAITGPWRSGNGDLKSH